MKILKISLPPSSPISIQNFETGSQVINITGHNDSVNSVAISQDGKYIASGSSDKTIIVWKFESTKLVCKLEGHTNIVTSVVFSSDGNYIISGSYDNTVKVWMWKEKKLIETLNGHDYHVTSVAVSKDDQFLVSGSKDQTVKIWKFGSWLELISLFQHNSYVNIVAISPNSLLIASGSQNSTINLWQFSESKLQQKCRFFGNEYGITALIFSADSKYMLSGGGDNSILVWSIEDEYRLMTLTEHSSYVNAIAISTDSKFIISGSRDKSINVWLIQGLENNVPNSSDPNKKQNNKSQLSISDRIMDKQKNYFLLRTICRNPQRLKCLKIKLFNAQGLTDQQHKILNQLSEQDLILIMRKSKPEMQRKKHITQTKTQTK